MKSKTYEPILGDKWHYGEEFRASSCQWDIQKYFGPCPLCGSRTFSYGGGWRCMAMYCFNSAGNPISNLGPEPEWWKEDINVVKDGNIWCATYSDFINLQESIFGYGDTLRDAVNNLKHQRDEK